MEQTSKKDKEIALRLAADELKLIAEVTKTVEMLKVEGMTFKVKARMQAEDYLGTAFAMVKNPNISDSVRADLIKNTVRWAGYDKKADEATGVGKKARC